jgi:ubiquinone/menaquinone biosynthesis C-methylase UbiE
MEYHNSKKNLQCHECPARAITRLVKEAFRVLRPGGTIALTDNSVGVSFVSLFIEYKCSRSKVLEVSFSSHQQHHVSTTHLRW